MIQEESTVNFISTSTVTLLSLVGQNMPNLLRYIVQHASRKNTKDNSTSQALSSQQIQKARLHPSKIMLYALDAIAIIQKTRNTINDKIEELTIKRTNIEQTLANLQKQQTTQQDTNTTPNEDTDKKAELEKLLLDIDKIRLTLHKHLQQLEQLLPQTDTNLPPLEDKWLSHIQKCCALLIKDLEEKAKIKLEENEQTILQNTLLDPAYLAKTRVELTHLLSTHKCNSVIMRSGLS